MFLECHGKSYLYFHALAVADTAIGLNRVKHMEHGFEPCTVSCQAILRPFDF